MKKGFHWLPKLSSMQATLNWEQTERNCSFNKSKSNHQAMNLAATRNTSQQTCADCNNWPQLRAAGLVERMGNNVTCIVGILWEKNCDKELLHHKYGTAIVPWLLTIKLKFTDKIGYFILLLRNEFKWSANQLCYLTWKYQLLQYSYLYCEEHAHIYLADRIESVWNTWAPWFFIFLSST